MKVLNLGEAWKQPAVSALMRSPGIVEVFDEKDAEAFVCWGMRSPWEERIPAFTAEGRTVWVVDSGYINRPQYGRDPQPSDYYSLNKFKVCNPVPTARALAVVIGQGERAMRREKFAHMLDNSMTCEAIGRMVILGQTVGDRSHAIKTEKEMFETYLDTARSFGRWVRFRPHPQDGSRVPRWLEEHNVPVLDPGVPLLEQLQSLGGNRCLMVWTLSSNAGFLAMLDGYYVVTARECGAWYDGCTAETAFGHAVDAQFNCDELERYGHAILSA